MTLSAVPDAQTEEFLFDFLYVDRSRIASYYAQLFDDGIHTATKTVSSTNTSTSDKTTIGFPKILGAEFSGADATQSAVERQYDAAWHLPLNLLKELNERGYVEPDITAARLGQIVHFKGKLQVIDLRMVQRMWEPLVEIQSLELPVQTASQRKGKAEQTRKQKHVVKILENMPHTLQMRGFNDENQVWSTLVPEHLSINPADLSFKHGVSIPGEWSMIAVLDAHPVRADDELNLPRGIGEVESGILQMMLMLKVYFGKQDDDFGVTPLAIYRRVERS